MKKIVITGATGLIGKSIAKQLIRRGDEVTVLTRSAEKAKSLLPEVQHIIEINDTSDGWYSYLEGKDAVINLAGENLMSRRWNEKHKKKISESRVKGTQTLVSIIKKLNKKPEVLISASAVGYYGNTENSVDEASKMGNDFLAKVVQDWEYESSKVEQYGVRRVNIRLGVVLDKKEGAFPPMLKSFKYYVGGTFGNGRQWFPWIHIDDVAGIFLFAVDNANMKGEYNAVSPKLMRQIDFCKTLGKIINRPSIFRIPGFFLKILFGEGAGVLLNGAHVLPKRTLECGYVFKYSDLNRALNDLTK
jgi:uncharacterized protein